VFKYKQYLWQLVLRLIAVRILQIIFPFLTQSIVDIGIKNQDVQFIYLVLFAQLALFIGRTAIQVIRSWILLHLSTRINISLVSDFFIKLINQPIAFFDSRVTGDILQRINDHRRVERILTTSSLDVLFSMVNLAIFSIVLLYYNVSIFSVFALGGFWYFLSIVIFLKKRKDLDYKRFAQVNQEQSKVIEIINGMQDIKLHNAEKRKHWNWEFTQARLYKVAVDGLALEQYQSVGFGFINELKNMSIQLLSTTLVISGDIRLGMMLAISYIVGRLKKAVNDYDKIYILRAPTTGRLSFTQYWKEEQQVQQGDLLFTVFPEKYGSYIATLKAPILNSGKLKQGQKTFLKLQNFPEAEFGVLAGEVSTISQIPDADGFYYVQVSLSDTLITSYTKEIKL
jgi:ATP-binding cassette subfamily B protein